MPDYPRRPISLRAGMTARKLNRRLGAAGPTGDTVTATKEDVVLAMKCSNHHVTLWPVDLERPTTCPCYVGEGDRCSTFLRDTGARFQRLP